MREGRSFVRNEKKSIPFVPLKERLNFILFIYLFIYKIEFLL